MLTRFDRSDGLGAIYPPMVWSIIALKCLGYPDDSPEMQYCHEELQKLVIEDEQAGTARLQPCKSPVWDTAIAVRALAASGVRPDNPAMREAIALAAGPADQAAGRLDRNRQRRAGRLGLRVRQRLLSRQRRHGHGADGPANAVFRRAGAARRLAARTAAGRSAIADRMLPHDGTKTGGASAELDDTVSAIDLGLRWMLAMQNRDGGWGAFDRNNNREFLCHVPFADHNAMIDPSTPDLAGRVLEALGQLGRRLGDPAVDRAVAYVRRTQNADGSWFGRWGVNYIYGTWQAITGLAAVGVPADDPAIVAGANWLLVHQQACGGWGESPDSYEFPHLRGQGTPTASQTAWALLGLLAAGMERHPAVARGIRYLIVMQNDDGTWDEAGVHRHRLPPRVLPAIPLLPHLLPAAGAFAMGGEGRSERGRRRSATDGEFSRQRQRQVGHQSIAQYSAELRHDPASASPDPDL